MTSGFDITAKDLEKMKYELSEMIENKFDHSMRNLEMQTKQLVEDYESLSANLKNVGEGLVESFNDKVLTVKQTAATFFAKTEAQVIENVTETKRISREFEVFSGNFVNPSKELDAKVYSMQMKIQASEQVRESQFTLTKEVIKKLLFSLNNRSHS